MIIGYFYMFDHSTFQLSNYMLIRINIYTIDFNVEILNFLTQLLPQRDHLLFQSLHIVQRL
jgi:hypothetical protein